MSPPDRFRLVKVGNNLPVMRGPGDEAGLWLSWWLGPPVNPQPMDSDSLVLLSEAEGFVAEQSMDQSIVKEVNMAKAMQNRSEETLIKALRTVEEIVWFSNTKFSCWHFLRPTLGSLFSAWSYHRKHISLFPPLLPCESSMWVEGWGEGSMPTHVSAKKDKYHVILVICFIFLKCYKWTYL